MSPDEALAVLPPFTELSARMLNHVSPISTHILTGGTGSHVNDPPMPTLLAIDSFFATVLSVPFALLAYEIFTSTSKRSNDLVSNVVLWSASMVNLALAVLFSAHVPLIWEALVCIHHVLHSVQAICDSAYPLVADPSLWWHPPSFLLSRHFLRWT